MYPRIMTMISLMIPLDCRSLNEDFDYSEKGYWSTPAGTAASKKQCSNCQVQRSGSLKGRG